MELLDLMAKAKKIVAERVVCTTIYFQFRQRFEESHETQSIEITFFYKLSLEKRTNESVIVYDYQNVDDARILLEKLRAKVLELSLKGK
jgi:hypothetical protein